MKNEENCPFFGDAAVMLVLIQFRQHGRETPPVIKRRTVRSFRPALAWQCPVYPSGVMIWADFIIPVIPEMRSALMQKIIFPLYRWDFGCPYPEHMAKHRESPGSMVILPWKRLKNGSISDIVLLHIFIIQPAKAIFSAFRCFVRW